MARKSERQSALELVGAYHEEQLSVLLGRAGDAVDRFRSGEADAFEADAVLFQYGRAAKELWKFCNIGDAFSTAAVIADGPALDWWARGAFRKR